MLNLHKTAFPTLFYLSLKALGKNTGAPLTKRLKYQTMFLYSLFRFSSTTQFAYQLFANGRKSNHAMPSILAGVSTFKTAYTTSPYVLQPLESALSS